jgi:hypothetical protein
MCVWENVCDLLNTDVNKELPVLSASVNVLKIGITGGCTSECDKS